MITCWGFGPHKAAFRAFIPSSWPIISSNFFGLVFSDQGSVKDISLSLCSFSISFFDSFPTADLLPCCPLTRFRTYNPIPPPQQNCTTTKALLRKVIQSFLLHSHRAVV